MSVPGGSSPSDWEWQQLRKAGSKEGWLTKLSEVHLGDEIGKGCFGTTYKGRWRNMECAVKIVRVGQPNEARSFFREVTALSNIKHPNVLPFYGAVLAPPENCWLICEYMSGGSLATWLYGEGVDPRSGNSPMFGPRHLLGTRAEVALDIARGMHALEAATPQILHRDLKPSNIFMDASGCAQVSDLGLARHMPGSSTDPLTGETGTFYYMAPEVIRSERYDSKADVFSWGVLFAELLAAKPPYADGYHTPIQVAQGVAKGNLRPTIPKGVHPGLVKLAQQAMDGDPSLRPTFASIIDSLTPLATEVQRQDKDAASNGGIISRIFSGSSAPEKNPAHHHLHRPHLPLHKT